MGSTLVRGRIQLYKRYTEDYILEGSRTIQFEVFQYGCYMITSRSDYTPIGNKIARWIKQEKLDTSMS